MDLIKKFEKDANIQTLKYVISKRMFCDVNGAMLDYRNAIMITAKDTDGMSHTRVIDGRYAPKVDELKSHYESKGFEVEIFVNVKKR